MRLAKQILGWVLMVLAILLALYLVSVLLSWFGGTMQGITFEESVGYGPGHAVLETIEAFVIAGPLFLGGLTLVRRAKVPAGPPDRPDIA
jgi:predicted ABC-type sugar transport system permease subunit